MSPTALINQAILARASRWSSRYWLVLLLVAVSYVACAIQTGPNPSSLSLLIQLVTIAVTLQVAAVRPRIRRFGWMFAAAIGIATLIGTLFGAEGHALDVALAAVSIVAYAAAAAIIIADQVRQRSFNLQALWAVIAAYVMVGLSFTFVYNLVSLVSSTPVFGEGQPDSLSSQLFFSFTTLTTTGYGNMVPVTPMLQSIAILEAIAGQLFLITAVARIVNAQKASKMASTAR